MRASLLVRYLDGAETARYDRNPACNLERRQIYQERRMGDSVGDKLSRVRAPRVHITYQVDTGGSMVMKELPFVMGVLGDFTSNPKATDVKLKDRDFIEVNLQ